MHRRDRNSEKGLDIKEIKIVFTAIDPYHRILATKPGKNHFGKLTARTGRTIGRFGPAETRDETQADRPHPSKAEWEAERNSLGSGG